MQFELHRDPEIFERLHGEWNALLERAITRVPFLRAEYQQAWWTGRGGGEWPDGELRVVTARDAAGALVGVAPLFQARNRDGRPALLLIGCVELSDYLDFVVAREEVQAFCDGLLDRLLAPDAAGWEVLDLYNLPGPSPTRAALASAARAHGWPAGEQLLQPVPAIALPADWETYLATMVEKKERHEIRRKLRRAESSPERVTWRMAPALAAEAGDASPAPDLAVEIETFLALMAHNPGKASFLTSDMQAQFRAIAAAMGAHGWLRLAWLEVNGEPAAAYLNSTTATACGSTTRPSTRVSTPSRPAGCCWVTCCAGRSRTGVPASTSCAATKTTNSALGEWPARSTACRSAGRFRSRPWAVSRPA
jgi:hypothetical protein